MINQLQLKENLKEGLFLPKDRDFFLKKILVDNQQESAFLYKGNGADFFDKIIKSGKYAGYIDEMNLLKREKHNILKFVGNNITDIGCGNGDKAALLLEGQGNKKYTPCDYSATMMELAEDKIRVTNPDVEVGTHQVMRQGNFSFTGNLKDNTYLRLGQEIGCHTDLSIKENLSSMDNKGILSGNKILFSYFKVPKTHEELQYTKNMYDNKEGADFILNGLHNLGIDTSLLKHYVDYNVTTNTVEIGVEFLEDCEIGLSNGDKIYKKKGNKSVIHKSKRFTDEEIKQILKESGLKVKKTFSENNTVLIVADRAPKYGKKIIKITGITSGLIVAMFLGGIGTYNYLKLKQEEEKQKRIDEVIDKKLKDRTFSFYGLNEIYDKGEKIDKKKKHLEEVTQSMLSLFKEVYGDGENLYAVKAIIANTLLETDEYGKSKLESLWHLPIDWSVIQEKNMLVYQIVPSNEIALAKLGYNTVPYNNFLKYKQLFDHNIMMNQDISITLKQGVEISGKEISKKLKTVNSNSDKVLYEYIGTFYDYSNYASYNFIKVYDKNGQEIVLASDSPPSYGDDWVYNYSFSYAKEGILKLENIWLKYKKQAM